MISDETLMAYADGLLLTQNERRVVSDAISRDPALARRLEGYFATRAMARRYDFILDLPLPAQCLELIERAPLSSPAERMPVVRTDSERPERFWQGIRALAASLGAPAWIGVAVPALAGALLATAGIWLLQPSQGMRPQELVEGIGNSPSFQRALEQTAGSAASELPELAPWAIVPTYTFQTKSGAWCRRYDLVHAPQLRSTGIACRGDDGSWRIGAHSPAYPYISPGDQPKGPVVPAARPPLAKVDSAEDNIIASDRLTGTEEESTMRKGWRKRP